MEAAKAGLDLSSISVDDWKFLLDVYDIRAEAELIPGLSGWHWWQRGTTNLVVTANNPLTGLYWVNRGNDHAELGYTGYVGIEGDEYFVSHFFTAFQNLAEFIKDEVFGRRSFI